MERFKKFLLGLQEIFFFAIRMFGALLRPPWYFRETYEQLYFIGVGSLFLIVLTGIAAGQALALQTTKELADFGAKDYIGRIMTISVLRALGPVLTGLMVAARVASGITAEIGAMRSSNQIDALIAFGTDPIKKLAVPRLVSLLIMLPALTLITDAIAITGGFLIAKFISHVSAHLYWANVKQKLTYGNFLVGIVKPFAFAIIIAAVACYKGFTARGGTKGVGLATMESVVISSITILVVDFLLTKVVFSFLGWSA